MLRYFVAAQAWLAAALTLLLARGYARTSPDFYDLFGVGWISPSTYRLVVLVCFVLAAVFTGLWLKTLSAPSDPNRLGNGWGGAGSADPAESSDRANP